MPDENIVFPPGGWLLIDPSADYLITDDDDFIVTDEGLFLIVAIGPQPPYWTVIGTGEHIPSDELT